MTWQKSLPKPKEGIWGIKLSVIFSRTHWIKNWPPLAFPARHLVALASADKRKFMTTVARFQAAVMGNSFLASAFDPIR
jgi:hypothetical protein